MNLKKLLKSNGLADYWEVLMREKIDRDSFLLLTDDDLKDLNIPLGPRKQLAKLQHNLSLSEVQVDGKQIGQPRERRHLTVLICDLVRSTELAEQMDPEKFGRILETYLTDCSETIKEHGGLIASYAGDAIKAYFGYPHATEHKVVDAISCGLMLIDQIGVISQVVETELSIRVGIASGPVVIGDFSGAPAGRHIVAFGYAAHLASRLQDKADLNTLFVDKPTLDASKGRFEFVDIGMQTLKGFSDPIGIYKITQATGQVCNTLPFSIDSPLIGRENILRSLSNVWLEVLDKRGGNYHFLIGEPGIGKTRLVAEYIETNALAFSDCIILNCEPDRSNSSLFPWIKWLEQFSGSVNVNTPLEKISCLRNCLMKYRLQIGQEFQVLCSLMNLDDDKGMDRVYQSDIERKNSTISLFARLLRRISNTLPLSIVIEDVQWIDQTSRELLTKLIRNITKTHIHLLVTLRDSHLQEWSEISVDRQFVVDRLTSNQSELLARRSLTDSTFTETDVQEIILRAQGVPFFIEELSRSIDHQPIIKEESASSSNINSQTVALNYSLLARLDRLGPAKQVAEIAAVIGRSFSRKILIEVSGFPEYQVSDALRVLIEHAIIVPNIGRTEKDYEFKHILLKESAEGLILTDQRCRYHERVADIIEQSFPEIVSNTPEVLAQHYQVSGNTAKEVDYWFLAADKAMKTWAKTESARFYDKGLSALDALRDSPDVRKLKMDNQIKKGKALYHAFGYLTEDGASAYQTAIDISRNLGEEFVPIEALDGLFGNYFNSAQWNSALRVSEQLIEIGERYGLISALVLGKQFKGMTLFCTGNFVAAREHLSNALSYIDMKIEIGSDFPSMAYIYLSWTAQIIGDSDLALASINNSENIAVRQESYRVAAHFGNSCVLFAIRDEVDEVETSVSRLVPVAERFGYNFWLNAGRFFSRWVECKRGNSKSGIKGMLTALEGFGDQQIEKTFYFGLVAEAMFEFDKLIDAKEMVDKAIHQSETTEERYCISNLYRLKGDIELMRLNDSNKARKLYEKAISIAQGQQAGHWEQLARSRLTGLPNSEANNVIPLLQSKGV